jgi:hydroxypyruvate isomerase
MPRYSVSLGFFFTDVPLTARFARAREAGFGAVEMFWPGDVTVADLVAAQRAAEVEVVLFNLNEGRYELGERGFAAVPERQHWWRRELEAALALAMRLDCHRVNVLAGDVPVAGMRDSYRDCLVDNLRWAAPRAADLDVTLLVEPLNHVTHPRALCQRTADVLHVLDQVAEPNVGLQYDVFHAQRSEGNIVDTMRAQVSRIGHIQIADVPSRSAPGTGELNFPYILREIDRLDYDGYVGLEYQPPAGGADPFDWLEVSLRGQR